MPPPCLKRFNLCSSASCSWTSDLSQAISQPISVSNGSCRLSVNSAPEIWLLWTEWRASEKYSVPPSLECIDYSNKEGTLSARTILRPANSLLFSWVAHKACRTTNQLAAKCVSVNVYCTDVGQLTEARQVPSPPVFYLHDLEMCHKCSRCFIFRVVLVSGVRLCGFSESAFALCFRGRESK